MKPSWNSGQKNLGSLYPRMPSNGYLPEGWHPSYQQHGVSPSLGLQTANMTKWLRGPPLFGEKMFFFIFWVPGLPRWSIFSPIYHFFFRQKPVDHAPSSQRAMGDRLSYLFSLRRCSSHWGLRFGLWGFWTGCWAWFCFWGFVFGFRSLGLLGFLKLGIVFRCFWDFWDVFASSSVVFGELNPFSKKLHQHRPQIEIKTLNWQHPDTAQ